MTRYWSADIHFGHDNVIGYDNRPWNSVESMNAGIIERWNDTVSDSDEVWFLGDLAMGRLEDTVPLGKQLKGRKILIPGNHDAVHNMHMDRAKRRHGWDKYADVFDEIWMPTLTNPAVNTTLGKHQVIACHFPYREPGSTGDKFSAWRPDDTGKWLICGHVHTRWLVNGRQINVGCPVWDYFPVSDDWLIDLIENS